jgi:hypothetical protein
MTLDEWLAEAASSLDLDPGAVDKRLVLDLARDVAHAVERPAAPLTAYLLCVAVGRGADPVAAAQTVSALARSHAMTDPG